MAIRNVKGKARTESPRIKDLPRITARSARDPSEGRDTSGRFVAGNRAAVGRAAKTMIGKGLGDPKDPATAELVRAARTLYLSILRTLPSDGPAVRQLVASQARHAVLATHYADLAAHAGLATKAGMALAEASRSHDTTAQRLSVTAYDRAVREAAAAPPKTISIVDQINAAVAAGIAPPLPPKPQEPNNG